jgi:hypothetical protein
VDYGYRESLARRRRYHDSRSREAQRDRSGHAWSAADSLCTERKHAKCRRSKSRSAHLCIGSTKHAADESSFASKTAHDSNRSVGHNWVPQTKPRSIEKKLQIRIVLESADLGKQAVLAPIPSDWLYRQHQLPNARVRDLASR